MRPSSIVPLALLLLAVAILLLSPAGAQTDPPASGDWTVGDNTTVENRTVRLHGNLTVVSGGNLTLRNVTLQVLSTIDALHGILVKDSGSLVVEDLDGDANTTDDRSVVSRGNPSYGYSFLVDRGARFLIENSLVTGMGDQRGTGGVLVRSSGHLIKGTTFISGHEYGLMLEGSNGSLVQECGFFLSDLGLVLEGCDNITVENCTMSLNDRLGLQIDASTGCDILGCDVSDNDQAGLRVNGGSDNLVEDTRVFENLRGVVLMATTDLSLVDAFVNNTTFEGVVIEGGCANVEIYNTYIFNCGRSGLEADHVTNLSAVSVGIWDCRYYGMRVLNGSRGLVLSTLCEGNGYDGLHIENARDLLFGVGTYRDNGYNGVFIIDAQNVTVDSAGIVCTNNTYDGLNCDSVVDADLARVDAWWNGYNGAHFQAGSHDIDIRSLDTRFNARSGLLLDSAYNVTMQGLFWSNAAYGVRIEGEAHNVTGSGVYSANNTAGALRLQSCNDIRLNSTVLLQNASGGHMAYGRDAVDVWIANSTTNGSVHLINGCNVSLVVCNFDAVTPDLDTTSYLHFHTLVDVEVIWPNTTPAVGAEVNATGRGGRVQLRGATGDDGHTGEHPLLMESYIGEAVAYQNPYTFWARKGAEVAKNATNILGRDVVQIILQDNLPPVAVATGVVAELGHPTMLDGSASTDNGQLVSWVWTFDDGVGTVVLEGERVNWTFPVLGNFSGTLEVSDSVGMDNLTSFTIAVVDTTPPEVVAGENATVDQGVEVTADGRGTTDNDSTLLATGLFIWRVVPEGGGAGERMYSGPIATIAFPDMGAYVVWLNVTDQSGNWAKDRFWVTVNDTTSPSVDAGPNLEVDEGTSVVLEPSSVTDNDPDFDAGLGAWWEVTGSGTDLVLDGLTASFIASSMGVYTATLHVTDAAGNVGTGSRQVTALDAQPPVVDIGADRTVEVLTEVAIGTGDVTDNDPAFPDGAAYRWTLSGPELDEEHRGNSIAFTVPWVGEYTVTLTVTDAAGNEGLATITVTSVDSASPEFGPFSPADDETSPGTDVTVTFVITDAGTGVEGDSVEMRTRGPGDDDWSAWQRISVAGSANRVEETMVLQFPEGQSTLQLRCWDRAGNGPVVSEQHTVRVNSRPRVVVLAPQDGAEYGPADTILLDASASSDVDGDELFFRWSTDRSGVVGTNATVRLAPLEEGDHVITVSVTDGVPGHEVLAQVAINVLPVPSTVDDDDGVPWWVVLAIVLLVMGTALLLWDHRRRRGRRPPDEAEEWIEATGG